MRRAVTLLATAVLLVAMTGCSRPASSASSYYLPPAVLGTTASGEALDTTTAAPQPGVQNSTFPRAAFAGKPGVSEIAVASGPTTISHDRAVELARPTVPGNPPTVQLRSAIHVTLPAVFVTAVSKGARTKATSAWMVTYSGLPSSHPAGSMPGQTAASDRTVALDAETGAIIATSDYVEQ